VARGRISRFPIDLRRRPYNTLALPCECVILAKLFNMFIRSDHVPVEFGVSYTVPLLKGSASRYRKKT